MENERLAELLHQITELDDDQLIELRDIILAQADSFSEDGGAVPYEELASLAAAAESLNAEQERRRNQAKRANDARGVIARFRTESRNGPVVPSDRRPRYTTSARAVTAAGVSVPDRDALAQEFANAIRQGRAPNTQDGRVIVATVHSANTGHGELRQGDSAEAITAAIDTAAADHARTLVSRLADPAALTAAGGLGAPEDVDYALPGFEVTDRPVKAALPTFTTSRGGVRYIRPPMLSDLNGSVGIWDLADDIAAVTNEAVRKPSFRVTPGPEIVVNVQAVTSSLIFGNLMQRAYPEYIARITDLAMATHARIAEQQLLTQIGALSTQVTGAVGEGAGLGATRVLLPLLDRAAVGMRDRMRMNPDAPLQLILPHWARAILRSDLAMQEPGDSVLGVGDAELAQYLATRNVAVTWAMDGEAGQHWDVQNPGAVNSWPTQVIAYMWPAGAFAFMDGGTLDLGIVRDSQLIAANDFMIFTETFENVLFRGGLAYRLTQALTPTGVARAAAAA